MSTHPPRPKLSICIATYNRADFIGATLDSVLPQVTDECEVFVCDNASTDDTPRVVAEYTRRYPQLRYFRHDTNCGLDRNFDFAATSASGEYCWLFPDDDLLKPGAIARVLSALRNDPSLVLVNVEIRDVTLTKVLQPRWLNLTRDRSYKRGELDKLFVDLGDILTYIGYIIVRRDLWVARDRERYYDSLFIHVGTIFQQQLPADALLIAEPLVIFRQGNSHSYSSQGPGELLLVSWPRLIGSLALSESARTRVRSAEPWRHPRWLLLLRGLGLYSWAEYIRCIRPNLGAFHRRLMPSIAALLPAPFVNRVLVLYYQARGDRGHWLYALRQSRARFQN